MKSAKHMLTESNAVKIYEFKLTFRLGQQDMSGLKQLSLRGQSEPVSKLFGVSSRVVRDIWNRRTWAFVTKPLWSQESAWISNSEESEVDSSLSNKTDAGKLGRSKGSRYKSNRALRSKNEIVIPTTTTDVSNCDFVHRFEYLPWLPNYTIPSEGSMCSARPIDHTISWLDALHFSAKSDPFHNDWPYW